MLVAEYRVSPVAPISFDPSALMADHTFAVDRRNAGSALGRRQFGDAVTARRHRHRRREFERRFTIVSDAPAVTLHLFGPVLIAEHLEHDPPNGSLHNGTLLIHRPGHLQDPTAVATLTGPLARIADPPGQ